jgi:deoxyribodipyrimidine photo-lyase
MSRTLYWLGNDLRLDDNAALLAAAQSETLLICYCIEPRWFSQYRYHTASLGPHRWQFIKQSLADLQKSLRQYDQGIVFVIGAPQDALPALVEAQAIDRIVRSYSVGVDEQRWLSAVRERCPRLEVIECDTQTLFDRELLAGPASPLPSLSSFSKFRKLAERQNIALPLSAPAQLPPPPANLARESLQQPIPDLSGYVSTPCPYTGGETAAREHLQAYFAGQHASTYKLTRNALDGHSLSSKFSPWLSNGSLSVRRALAEIKQYEGQHGANDSTYWLYIEMLWREFFQWLAAEVGTALFAAKGINRCAGTRCFYPERFEKWCQGTTPYPIVNACMQQLRQTGFLSNRGRQIAASCLVNELDMDWRYGAAWFEHQLVDFDVASNWGNWQYIAGVGVDPRGGRHFNLSKQAELFDQDGAYVERWSPGPVLENLDTRDAADWPLG